MGTDELFVQDLAARAAKGPDLDVDTTGVIASARRRRSLTRSVAATGAVAGVALAWSVGVNLPSWSDQAEHPAGTAWAPPAWLAGELDLRAMTREELQSCMDEKGWDVTMDEWGGAAEGFTPEEHERFVPDRDACAAEVERALPAASSFYDVPSPYERELFTRECVEAEGYELRVAPSEEDFLAGAVMDPYSEPALLGLPLATTEALQTVCPQRWR